MSEIANGKYGDSSRSQHPWRWAILLPISSALIWGSWVWWVDRSYRDAIMRIELDMVNNRLGTAARDLRKLLAQYPDSGEVALLLARCERERGYSISATKVLERVAPGSVFSHRAILARMRIAHDNGQFALAEQIVETAAADPRNDRTHARFLLVPIYSQLGRLDEARQLIEERWEYLNEIGEGATEPALDLVRMHIELSLNPNPIENVHAYLDQALHLAPDDDRVWLGQANLAIRTGAYNDADRYIHACMKRRPDDIAVWCAYLSWAVATNQIDVARQALKRLPANRVTPAQIHRLNAWFAAKRGDIALERQQLERLVSNDPADLTAIDRLAKLAQSEGNAHRVTELLSKKTEINRLLSRYRKLHDRNQPIRDAEELAGLAEQLGRQFEARVFLTVTVANEYALDNDPEAENIRQRLKQLSERSKPANVSGQTLADLIVHDPQDIGGSRPTHED